MLALLNSLVAGGFKSRRSRASRVGVRQAVLQKENVVYEGVGNTLMITDPHTSTLSWSICGYPQQLLS